MPTPEPGVPFTSGGVDDTTAQVREDAVELADAAIDQADIDAAVDAAATVRYVGTSAAPVTNAALARPSVAGPVYWICAIGVTPANAADADIIWNADA